MIFEDSRYETANVVPVADHTGTYRATVVPCCSDKLAVRYSVHRVRHGDRLDLLAGTAYGDPEQWWRIADANPEVFFPDELTPGILIRIPVGA